MESRHLLNLSVQNALDCISENFNLKHFPGRACTRNSLEKDAVRSLDGLYGARIGTVYYISKPPLSQNPPSAPETAFNISKTWYNKWVNSLAPTYLCPNFRKRPLDIRERGELDATPGELSSGFLRV